MTASRYQTTQPSRSVYTILGLTVALFVVIADQSSKIFVRDLLHGAGSYINVTPFFNIVDIWNRGISFGLLPMQSSEGVMILLAIAGILTALFLVILLSTKSAWVALGCGAIIGGSIGNMIDRVYYGAVYDFLDFHLYEYHWPAFNLADTSVFIGVVLMGIEYLLLEPKRTTNTQTANPNDEV